MMLASVFAAASLAAAQLPPDPSWTTISIFHINPHMYGAGEPPPPPRCLTPPLPLHGADRLNHHSSV